MINGAGWRGYLPILSWLPRYKPAWLRYDLIAALTAWALIVPQAIAYAQIAGLPPHAGLAAAAAGLIVYALLGTSRQLMVSPTSSTAAISASLVAAIAVDDVSRFGGLSSTLAIICGLCFAVLGFARLGFVSRFIPTPVQVGFMFGLGLTIIAGQLPKILGTPSVEGTFVQQISQLLPYLGDINPWTLGLGVAALAALLIGSRYVPAVPMALIVVIIGIAAVAVFDLAARGVEVIGVVEGGLPLPALPSVELADLTALIPGAVAIAIIGSAEALTIAERFADKHDYDIRPDQELVAAGGANVVSGFFQGFIVAGGASQSAAADSAGAKTLLASLLVGILVVITSLALLPLFRDLPQAVLGAIVISAVLGFLRVAELRRMATLRREGFAIALVALIAVLVLGILSGLIVAVLIAIVMVLLRIARPDVPVLGRPDGSGSFVSVDNDATAQQLPGLLVVRVDSPMLFLNAALVRDTIRGLVRGAEEPPKVVLLDLAMSPDIDIESLDVVAALARWLEDRGSTLWIAEVRAKVREMISSYELDPSIRVFESLSAAVAAHEEEIRHQ